MPLIGTTNSTTLSDVTAQTVALGNVSVVNMSGTYANPALQKLIAVCLSEIADGKLSDEFLRELAHFNRSPTLRNLKTKLEEAGKNDAYYEYAIEAKESFAKFFEIMARHPSGQQVLVAAFSHAYSVFREKINPEIGTINFAKQSEIFEKDVVLFLSHNLLGLPGFNGRNEALGLLFYLADNCFIEYANV